MKTIFYVDVYKPLIIKIVANKNVKKIFENYFDCEFKNEYSTENYVINYCGRMPNIDIPNDVINVHAFLGAKYKIWEKDNIFFALAESGQLKGSHFVKRTNNVIDVYIGKDEGDDIIFRVAREVIFRYLYLDGFVPMHASASIDNNNLVSVYFGTRQSGKTVMLCSKIHNAQEKPVATDVVMIRKVNDGYYCCGMPLKFSYAEKMLQLFNLKFSICKSSQSKIRIYNKDFDKIFNTKCIWGIHKVRKFLQVNFILSKDIIIGESTKTNNFEVFMDSWNFGDFLQLTPNKKINLETTYKDIIYRRIEGDFAKYVK